MEREALVRAPLFLCMQYVINKNSSLTAVDLPEV